MGEKLPSARGLYTNAKSLAINIRTYGGSPCIAGILTGSGACHNRPIEEIIRESKQNVSTVHCAHWATKFYSHSADKNTINDHNRRTLLTIPTGRAFFPGKCPTSCYLCWAQVVWAQLYTHTHTLNTCNLDSVQLSTLIWLDKYNGIKA